MVVAIKTLLQSAQELRAKPNAAMRTANLLREALRDKTAFEKQIGFSEQSGIDVLHRSDELTVLNVIWAPRMQVTPHNHNMWAVLGVYRGRELNTFWQRKNDSGELKQQGQKIISQGEVSCFGEKVIHSVCNPLNQYSAAIHIYGGDFFAMPRSEWDAQGRVERPYDSAVSAMQFAD